MQLATNLYFSDIFHVDPGTIKEYGAFNISLVNDIPLFIDPFLLFNSPKDEYQALHQEIIRYLLFLKEKVRQHPDTPRSMLESWFVFREVKQNWLGFCKKGNAGSALGIDFARSLSAALGKMLTDFGQEWITKGTHPEKVCLVKDGVGRDNISDFTTNLIKQYLLEFTEGFAREYLEPNQRRLLTVDRVKFNYTTESWESGTHYLPFHAGDYVLLTPTDILRREETWINRGELLDGLESLLPAIPDAALRFQVNNYFRSCLSKGAKEDERRDAARKTVEQYPVLLDYFIKSKEDAGDEAVSVSDLEVSVTNRMFHDQVSTLIGLLHSNSDFYSAEPADTFEDSMARIRYLKHVIENNDGYRVFYVDGQPIRREHDLHVMYRLVCYGSPYDVNSEVNNGRGPVDFKASLGSKDSTLVEFKLASNPKLKANLQKQVAVYAKANLTTKAITVIMYFTEREYKRVLDLLNELQLSGREDIVLIDARSDNKPSASVA